jgi:hypothetical protein
VKGIKIKTYNDFVSVLITGQIEHFGDSVGLKDFKGTHACS